MILGLLFEQDNIKIRAVFITLLITVELWLEAVMKLSVQHIKHDTSCCCFAMDEVHLVIFQSGLLPEGTERRSLRKVACGL